MKNGFPASSCRSSGKISAGRKKLQTQSLILFISTMAIFGTIGVFRRSIPLPSSVLAFVRGLLGSLVLLIFVLIRKRIGKGNAGNADFQISRSNFIKLIVSGIVMGFNWILLFEAYSYTTVAIATLCYYMEPTILILVSPVIFQEKLTPKKLLCATVAILGMVFVSGAFEGGSAAGSDLKGILLGLGAAALYATVVIINNTITGVDAYRKTMIQLASAAAIMIPYILLTEDLSQLVFSRAAVLMLLLVGIVHTGMAYAMYFGSMEGLKVQTIALFSYIDPIVALILSAWILKEPLSIYGIAGAVLIIGAAVFSELDWKPGQNP